MKKMVLILCAGIAAGSLVSLVHADVASSEKPAKYVVGSGTAQEKPAEPADKPAEAKPAAAKKEKGCDTLVITGRIIEIPGTFAPNDLYNYVYVMKYRVMKVLKGTYAEKEILVGQYNPLIPRGQIKDKMAPYVAGDAVKFEKGDIQKLVLITPISKVWNDAVEDEYIDVEDENKYYALKTDIAK